MWRHIDAERFGGLEVDRELELARLHYRQVGALYGSPEADPRYSGVKVIALASARPEPLVDARGAAQLATVGFVAVCRRWALKLSPMVLLHRALRSSSSSRWCSGRIAHSPTRWAVNAPP